MRFIVADSISFLTHSKVSDICWKPVYFIYCDHTYRKRNCEIPVQQRRKSVYAAGWIIRPPSAWKISCRLIACECIKDRTIVVKGDIETFVITEDNRAQTALCNQNLSSFNISSATCYSLMTFHHVGVSPSLFLY